MAAKSDYRGWGFATVLFVVFLVLKLTHVIAWSWLWVTSPLWIAAAFALVILALVLLIVHKVSKAAKAFSR